MPVLNRKKLFGVVPLFFPDKLEELYRGSIPVFYDERGEIIPLCSSLVTHNFDRGVKRCRWCGISREALLNSIPALDENIKPPNINDLSNQGLDLNANTSATIVQERVEIPNSDMPLVEDNAPGIMSVNNVEAYCLRCKHKVSVLNAKYEDVESSRGIRTYVRGSCSVCNSRINALTKRGGS